MTDTELTDATRAWPDHDPATKRTVPESSVPVDQDRVEKTHGPGVGAVLLSSTTGSSAHHARAWHAAACVTSSFQYWEPHPIAIESARPGSPMSTAANCSTCRWASAPCSLAICIRWSSST